VAVFVEFISVVVRRDALDERYKGGWDSFVDDVPNRTMCADRHLARVGFMSPTDTKIYVDRLERKGLTYLRDGKARSIWLLLTSFEGQSSIATGSSTARPLSTPTAA
jgi:hypothetical protein